jgi:hypothetical protein
MNIKAAEKELTARQNELNALNDSKTTFQAELESLRASRSEATKDLAAGNDDAHAVIKSYDDRIEPITLKIEGLDHLIQDAKDRVSVAEANFQEARNRRTEEMQRFIASKEQDQINKVQASIPARKQKIADLYTSLCQELGELLVDSVQFLRGERQDVQDIITFNAYGLPPFLNCALNAKGLKPLLNGSHGGIIDPVGCVIPDQPTGEQTLSTVDIANKRYARQQAKYISEFESLNG